VTRCRPPDLALPSPCSRDLLSLGIATLAALNDWSLPDIGPVACAGDPECGVKGVGGVGRGSAVEDVSAEGPTDGCAVLARDNGRLALLSLCSDGGLDRFPAMTLCSVRTSTRVIRDKQPVGKKVWDPHGYCTMEGCPRRIRYPTCHAQLLLPRRILLVVVATSQPWEVSLPT